MCHLSYLAYYIFPMDFPLIALDAHMFSHNGYGLGIKAQLLLDRGLAYTIFRVLVGAGWGTETFKFRVLG